MTTTNKFNETHQKRIRSLPETLLFPIVHLILFSIYYSLEKEFILYILSIHFAIRTKDWTILLRVMN
jgi:hypothetical protein